MQACNCKRTRNECQKTNYEKFLNYQKYHEILQNSKTLHTQFISQVEILQIGKVLQEKDHLKVLKTEMTFFLSLLARDQNHHNYSLRLT